MQASLNSTPNRVGTKTSVSMSLGIVLYHTEVGLQPTLNTVEPHLVDTSIIWTPLNCGRF